eukprot:scaffold3367_cov32-Cyclotella_meneghiniana.AAC.1
MPTYLKGLHLTIDGWRPGRDAEGFKVKAGVRRARPFIFWEWEEEQWIDLSEEAYDEIAGAAKPPERVRPVERLRRDVGALLALTEPEEPVLALARPEGDISLYLMGDASGKGFGSAFWDDKAKEYETGQYGSAMQRKSSNNRESDNLVTRIERLEEEGRLYNQEVFIFTDNSTFEGTYYKGHSTSEGLCDIILRLRLVQQRTGCLLHVIHIAGTRMKEAGIDGLSRGDLMEGMMKAGEEPWRFIPLALSASERMGRAVEDWVASWWGTGSESWCGASLTKLEPTDWFELRKVVGPRLWIPPPAAMETVIERFNEDRLVRPHLPHVFVVPRLMTHLWRKQLSKDADVIFTVESGPEFWPREMHEPLIVLIVLPLTPVSDYRGPWLLKGTDAATGMEKRLTQGFRAWRDARNDPEKFHELDDDVSEVWEGPQQWSRDI